jgi:hypothetical protein
MDIIKKETSRSFVPGRKDKKTTIVGGEEVPQSTK